MTSSPAPELSQGKDAGETMLGEGMPFLSDTLKGSSAASTRLRSVFTGCSKSIRAQRRTPWPEVLCLTGASVCELWPTVGRAAPRCRPDQGEANAAIIQLVEGNSYRRRRGSEFGSLKPLRGGIGVRRDGCLPAPPDPAETDGVRSSVFCY